MPTAEDGNLDPLRDEPLAREVVAAIHAGDIDAMRRRLQEHPGLATARLGSPPESCDAG